MTIFQKIKNWIIQYLTSDDLDDWRYYDDRYN